MHRTLSLGCGFLFVSLLAVNMRGAPAPKNMVRNFGFENLNAAGKPANWKGVHSKKKIEWVQEGSRKFIRITNTKQAYKQTAQRVALDPKHTVVHIHVTIRVDGLQKGDEDWKTVKFQFPFLDASGERLGKVPQIQVHTDQNWTVMTGKQAIPKGATQIEFQCLNFARRGTAEFDDVYVVGMEDPNSKFPASVLKKAGAAGSLAGAGGTAGTGANASARPGVKIPEHFLGDHKFSFGAKIVESIRGLRGNIEGKKHAVMIIGPGMPRRDVRPKLPESWTLVSAPSTVTGRKATPAGLLLSAPRVLAAEKPEIVLLVGEQKLRRRVDRTESEDWEDVVRLCAAYGAVPVLVIDPPSDNFDRDVIRNAMVTAAKTTPCPVLEIQESGEMDRRLRQLLLMTDEHIFGRRRERVKAKAIRISKEPAKTDTGKRRKVVDEGDEGEENLTDEDL